MGYQLIEAKLLLQSYVKKYIVYNSELIIELDEKINENKLYIFEKGYLAVLNESKSLLLDTQSIKLIPKPVVIQIGSLNESIIKNKHRYSGGKGAKENKIEDADGKEIFVRLSISDNDRRIDFIKKRLKDGAFTTTTQDYLDCLRFQDDPSDRYALPSNEKPKWSYYIQPKKGDKLQRGIVQPAFNHIGGGIEAYFQFGTSDSTYLDKRPYGK
jgi:hypothetical protein